MSNAKNKSNNKGYNRSGKWDNKSKETGKSNYSKRNSSKGKNDNKRSSKDSEGTTGYGKSQNSNVGHNDISWWNLNPEALRFAGQLPFGNATGNKIDWINEVTESLGKSALFDNTRAGVMSFTYAPTYGVSNSRSSVLNQAAERLFQYVRSKNTSYSPYDPADLMMYIVMMDQAYSWYAFMMRAAGFGALRDPMNAYLPEVLAHAAGVNYSSIMRDNLRLKQYITTYAAAISAFTYPEEFMIAKRHVFMNTHIYKDSPQRKSQFYVFKPAGIYTYSETTDTGSKCVWNYMGVYGSAYNATGLTVDEMIAIGEAIISPLYNSSDIAIMKADILKAYDESNLYMATAPSMEDFVIVPVYVEEMLTEIENMHTTAGLNAFENATVNGVAVTPFTITQDPNIDGYIKCDIAFASPDDDTLACFTLNHLLNFRKNDITPEDIMLATRFVSTSETIETDDATGVKYVFLDNVGTEVVTAIRIYGYGDSEGDIYSEYQTSVPQFETFDLTSLSGTAVKLRNSRLIDRFMWKPNFVRLYKVAANTGVFHYTMEEDTFNAFHNEVYEELNRVALFSALNIRHVGNKSI